jgi:hypothetical protein
VGGEDVAGRGRYKRRVSGSGRVITCGVFVLFLFNPSATEGIQHIGDGAFKLLKPPVPGV